MPRLTLLVASASIFIFGLLIGLVMLCGRVLPTKQLAFVSVQPTRSPIFLLDYYHRIRAEIIGTTYGRPAWSPNGEQLAFLV